MKIALVNDYEYGNGAAIACCRLGRALAELGHEVYYLYLYPGGGSPGKEWKSLSIENSRSKLGKIKSRILFRLHEKFARNSEGGGFLLSQYYRGNEKLLNRYLNRINPAVVHFHNIPYMMSHQGVAAVSRKFPTLWTMHDCHATNHYAYLYRVPGGGEQIDPPIPLYIKKDFSPDMVGNAEFICPSKWIADHGMQKINDPGIFHVIPNSVPLNEFYPVEKSEARKALGIGGGEKLVVLTVASDLRNVRKNFGLILDAVKNTESKYFEFIAVGSVSEEIRNKYPEIRFLGSVNDSAKLRQIYSAADVLVIPSLIDNLPNTILESMACGTPVLGANTGGIPDTMGEEKVGWLFDPYAEGELAQRLNSFAKGHEKIGKESARAAEYAASRFSPKLQAETHLALYETVIRKHRDRIGFSGLPS